MSSKPDDTPTGEKFSDNAFGTIDDHQARPSARDSRPRRRAENRTGAAGREAGQERARVESAYNSGFDARDVLLGKHDDATVAQAVVER